VKEECQFIINVVVKATATTTTTTEETINEAVVVLATRPGTQVVPHSQQRQRRMTMTMRTTTSFGRSVVFLGDTSAVPSALLIIVVVNGDVVSVSKR